MKLINITIPSNHGVTFSKIIVVFSLLSASIALSAHPNPDHITKFEPMNIQQQNTNAPKETERFAGLIGNWKVRDFFLDSEGAWQEGDGAD